MERRSFLKKTAFSAAALAATPAALLAAEEAKSADLPAVSWRLTSSFPKSLDTIYGASDILANSLAAITGGKFTVKIFAAGEIVPGLQVLDAVQNGTVEAGHSASYYYFGKNAALAFDCAVPFGLTARQQTAWFMHGNGKQLLRELFAEYNVVNFMGGNTGTQMGGWFNKEINSVKDLEGLKFRVSGFAGMVLSKLGVVPQQLPGGDIYPALEKGTIDAAEWVGPYDDEKLGFAKIVKNYYTPGWWEGGPQLSFYVNKDQWEKLPEPYKAAWEASCQLAHNDMLAKYDANNPQALANLVNSGVKLRSFSDEVMEACFKATLEVFEEQSKSNPSFKKIFDDWKVFRNNEAQWFNVAEQSFAKFAFNKKL
ncbi:TRAP transporter substrate-binding protein [Candidatus Thiothrix sp. Deng01]|uniref:TRAP transporter substrate-binding protein n=1 Tax=Candidatus Thiothrix phosphatis TaxID=3112415 RepID=A0ABU6CY89_9GAMM|nr:TRAP transporter substrate-binding protein [Candidatus Thiothrix sp. Deng01]MEB4591806.1 TRAP transporter substrate-binding protein [Candidatus Thiothrix sp. Deng01]